MLRATFTASVGMIESVMTSSLSLEPAMRATAPREHAMGDVGVDLLGALLEQGFGGVHQRAARIDDVVDEDAGAPFHRADDVHDFRLAGPVAALVDDRERSVDALGERAGADHAADVRRDDHGVLPLQPVLDVTRHQRSAEQVVGRNVEEALDLAGMEVERQDAVDAGMGDQVGDELGRDRGAAGGAPVLPGIAEIGITAVMRLAEERRSASTMISSSIRWSLVGKEVDWMTKTSCPRTFS